MIDYAKIFKDKILKDFNKEAKKSIRNIAQMRKAGIQHVPPRYKFSPVCNFGFIIDDINKDNINWVDGMAEAYTQKIAQLNRRSKIKSIDIKVYEPNEPKPFPNVPIEVRMLVGHFEFTR